MSNVHDDFAFEPVPGLPENLPAGERMLWQGSPDPWSFTVAVMRLRVVGAAVALLTLWRAATAVHDDLGFAEAVSLAGTTLLGGLAVLAMLAVAGHLMARGTIYTLTSHRLVIRHGVAMPMAINIPFARVAGAAAAAAPPGVWSGIWHGGSSIALTMERGSRASLIALWPHVRPMTLRRPEPALRGLTDGTHVASLLSRALEATKAEPRALAPSESDSVAHGPATLRPAEAA